MSLSVNIQNSLGEFSLNADFYCDKGVTALFGKSGAGKTSIVQLIAGLIQPDNGKIIIDDEIVFDKEKRINLPAEDRRVGYVFQESRLFPHMIVRKNLNFGMRRRKRAGFNTLPFDDVVDILGISNLLERGTYSLSGGERQRIALGRALLSGPRLLLMDEPLAALDIERRWEIIPFIERIHRQFDIPVIYVSHSVDEILQLADNMVLLNEGQVIAAGSIESVMNRPDLASISGMGDPSSVIQAHIKKLDTANGLAILAFDSGEFCVPARNLEVNARVRVRIRARDVSIALKKPEGISVLNIFPGTVQHITNKDEIQVDLSVQVGNEVIWAQITHKSLHDLQIKPGSDVFVMVKAMAIDQAVFRA
jgi:molybdate transport system ATP-binding protein|tara:strand:+ start:199 stop:1290 length:1092 start_codon:yes stop_codon:yes gene_type:complete